MNLSASEELSHQSDGTPRKLSENLSVSIIDPLTDIRWKVFVEGHPKSTVFHTAAWTRVLMDTYGYEPRYHVLERDDGAIQAAWPLMLVSSRISGRRLVSVPFCDHCEPLVRTENEAELLLDAIIADRSNIGASCIEVRGWLSEVPVPRRFVPVQYYKLYESRLESEVSVLFNRLSATTRRYVRQAERKGVTVRVADSNSDLEDVYSLNLALRRRHRMLPQPFSFFEAIDRHLIGSGSGHILLAERCSSVIGALVCLTHSETIMCKFALSDPRYWDDRPNHLLIWKSLEWAVEQGFRRYDFGRCGAHDTGLNQFKEQAGFVGRDLPYFYFPRPKGFSVTQPGGLKRRALAAFARMAPDPLYIATGARLYKHLG